MWVAGVVSAYARDQLLGGLEIMHAAISWQVWPIEFHETPVSVHLDVSKADAFNNKSAQRFYWVIQLRPVPSCHQLHFTHMIFALSPCL